jgi:hypothetical protein
VEGSREKQFVCFDRSGSRPMNWDDQHSNLQVKLYERNV